MTTQTEFLKTPVAFPVGMGTHEIAAVTVHEAVCPACGDSCRVAGGRGVCFSCNISFSQPRVSRRDLLKQFVLTYFVSRQTGVYHRAGCKYLKNVSADNLVETAEPYGRACGCVKTQ